MCIHFYIYFNENIVLNIEDIKRHQECNDEKEITDIINGLCDENYLTKNENNTYKVTIKGYQYNQAYDKVIGWVEPR